MLLKKLIHDSDHSPAQTVDGGEFPHVDTGQLFRQYRLVAGGKTPVGGVIGESLPDKVMLLQRAESVLKDRIVGTGLQRLPQLGERCGFLPPNSLQVLRGVE